MARATSSAVTCALAGEGQSRLRRGVMETHRFGSSSYMAMAGGGTGSSGSSSLGHHLDQFS